MEIEALLPSIETMKEVTSALLAKTSLLPVIHYICELDDAPCTLHGTPSMRMAGVPAINVP